MFVLLAMKRFKHPGAVGCTMVFVNLCMQHMMAGQLLHFIGCCGASAYGGEVTVPAGVSVISVLQLTGWKWKYSTLHGRVAESCDYEASIERSLKLVVFLLLYPTPYFTRVLIGFTVREQIRKSSTGQNTGQCATSDTMLTSQMFSPWCDCHRIGSALLTF